MKIKPRTRIFRRRGLLFGLGAVLISGVAVFLASETLSYAPPQRKPGEPESFIPTSIPVIKPQYKLDEVAPDIASMKNQRPNIEPLRTPDPKEPIQLHLSVYHVSNYKLAVRVSPIVITASVESIEESRWTTPDGKRPENIYASKEGYFIVTPVTFLIEGALKGNLQVGQRLTILTRGGKVSEDALDTDDERSIFQPGENVLLFLNRYSVNDSAKDAAQTEDFFIFERYLIDSESNQLVSRNERISIEQINEELQLVSSQSK